MSSITFRDQTFRQLHEQVGLDTEDVRQIDGEVSADRWLARIPGRAFDGTLFVRIVSVWRAILALLFNRVQERHVLLVWRGNHTGDVGGAERPDVLLDWDTYVMMLAGLKREQLRDLEFGFDDGPSDGKWVGNDQ